MTRTVHTIRKAVPQDAAGIIHLILSNWEDGDGHIARSLPLELADMFSNATFRPTFFVAETGEGRIVGCSFWSWSWANYDTFEFGWMCVDEAHRRQGLGQALHRVRLEDIKNHARPGLPHSVLLSTVRVARYERFGFRTICEEPNLMLLVVPAP